MTPDEADGLERMTILYTEVPYVQKVIALARSEAARADAAEKETDCLRDATKTISRNLNAAWLDHDRLAAELAQVRVEAGAMREALVAIRPTDKEIEKYSYGHQNEWLDRVKIIDAALSGPATAAYAERVRTMEEVVEASKRSMSETKAYQDIDSWRAMGTGIARLDAMEKPNA